MEPLGDGISNPLEGNTTLTLFDVDVPAAAARNCSDSREGRDERVGLGRQRLIQRLHILRGQGGQGGAADMYCDAYGNVYCGYYNDEGLDGDGDGGAEGRVARPQEGSKQRLERKKKERRERKAWLTHAKKDWDKYKASGRVWQVEQTYEAAMTSLNGRH